MSIKIPAVGTFVEIYFVAGDRSRPVYVGQVSELGEIPKSYNGKSNHVIFEDPENKTHIDFDGRKNELEIGKTDLQFCARKNDEVKSTNIDDATFWAYINAIALHVHPANGTPSPTLAIGIPSSLSSKITTGSDQIKVGKK
jgi:hypothetical protein